MGTFSCKMELTGEVYMNEYIGIDIGGTKTAIVRGDENGTILERSDSQRQRRKKLWK